QDDVAVLAAADQQHFLGSQHPAGTVMQAGEDPQHQGRGLLLLWSVGFGHVPVHAHALICPACTMRRSGANSWYDSTGKLKKSFSSSLRRWRRTSSEHSRTGAA